MGRKNPADLIDGSCEFCTVPFEDEVCHVCGAIGEPKTAREFFRVPNWRSVPDLYLHSRAAQALLMYQECAKETAGGSMGPLIELGVSLVEREALYRLLGVEDGHTKEMISRALGTIVIARQEGHAKGDEAKRQREKGG